MEKQPRPRTAEARCVGRNRGGGRDSRAGPGELRSRFDQAQPVWIVIACAFEVLSVLACVPAFRAVFCMRMSWATSYKIAVAEEGAGSLFPLGGAGSLALGVWALRRGGMPADEIARKTVAFFLLTSAPSVVML